MKKIILIASIGSILLTSCKSQGSAYTQNVQNVDKYDLKGEWTISSVDYEKKFKIKPFDEGADIKCFIGSTWNLIPNNGKGSYSLHGGNGCPAVTQTIMFDVKKTNEFTFKKLQDNVKAKNITEGYSLTLTNQQKNSFTLVQRVAFEGEIININYNFQRIESVSGGVIDVYKAAQ